MEKANGTGGKTDLNAGTIFNIQKFCLHDGAGIRTDVFFSGCNLRCRWCANPESQLPFDDSRSEAKRVTVEEVVREVAKDRAFYEKSGGGATLTGGEVLVQLDFALELCRALHAEGIHVAAETAGLAPEADFRRFAEEVDFVLFDCKHYDEHRHRLGTGRSNRQILENLAYLARSGKPFCVRIPVIPGFNDSLEDARKFCSLFAALGVGRVQLLPFHQFGEKKYARLALGYAYRGVPQIQREALEPYLKIMKECGVDAAIGG